MTSVSEGAVGRYKEIDFAVSGTDVYGTARYTRLSDEVTDSPMVDKSWTGLISTGITYKF